MGLGALLLLPKPTGPVPVGCGVGGGFFNTQMSQQRCLSTSPASLPLWSSQPSAPQLCLPCQQFWGAGGGGKVLCCLRGHPDVQRGEGQAPFEASAQDSPNAFRLAVQRPCRRHTGGTLGVMSAEEDLFFILKQGEHTTASHSLPQLTVPQLLTP